MSSLGIDVQTTARCIGTREDVTRGCGWQASGKSADREAQRHTRDEQHATVCVSVPVPLNVKRV